MRSTEIIFVRRQFRRRTLLPSRCYLCGRPFQDTQVKYAVMLPSLDTCNLCKPDLILSTERNEKTDLFLWNKVYRLERTPKYRNVQRCCCERCVIAASIDSVLHFYTGTVYVHAGQVPDSEGKGNLGIGEGCRLAISIGFLSDDSGSGEEI